jgi:RNA polymerase sigma factor (sigma-70 family)
MTIVHDPETNGPEVIRPGHPVSSSLAGLVHATLNGSIDAQAELFRTFHDDQRRVAGRAGLTECQIDDCVSMAWSKAMAALPNLRKPELFRSWLLSITRNVAVGIHRRGAREQLWGDVEELPGGLVSREDGAETQAVRREEHRILRAALADLDERDRTVVDLLFVERLPYDTVADLLDCAMGSIGPTRGRVIRRLRKAYQAHASAA